MIYSHNSHLLSLTLRYGESGTAALWSGQPTNSATKMHRFFCFCFLNNNKGYFLSLLCSWQDIVFVSNDFNNHIVSPWELRQTGTADIGIRKFYSNINFPWCTVCLYRKVKRLFVTINYKYWMCCSLWLQRQGSWLFLWWIPMWILQCCGSMIFWGGSGSGSADPCLWLMDPDPDSDPDPAIFVSDLQDASKKLIF